MPVLVLCSDCGAIINVRATKERENHLVMWAYCEKCASKRACETKKREAQKMLEQKMLEAVSAI